MRRTPWEPRDQLPAYGPGRPQQAPGGVDHAQTRWLLGDTDPDPDADADAEWLSPTLSLLYPVRAHEKALTRRLTLG